MNFKRIISKSSLKSTNSSHKSLKKVDEINKLQDEIKSLKLNTSSLKVILESRDAAIGDLARKKEKLYVELKSVQRKNINLQQELFDEREIYSKEKDFILAKMKKLSSKLARSRNSDAILDEEEHIMALQNEIKSKNEVICNICSKYFKLKKSKDELRKKFVDLKRHTVETFETIITSLESNKNSLDLLLDELRKSAEINPSYKEYIKLLKINADLNFENTQLKLFLIAKFNDDKVSTTPHCNLPEYQESTRPTSMNSVENVYRRSKPRSCKTPIVAEVYNKHKNINSHNNRKLRRSMSDSLLSRNVYK